MNELKLVIKLAFITGLRDVVVSEVSQYPNLKVIKEDASSLYLGFVEDLTVVKDLRSVTRAYIVVQSSQYNPLYISNHKSVLDNLMEVVIGGNQDTFKSFKIICAGSDSPEVRSIANYIRETYGISEKEEADMKIHIVKSDEVWEVGVQMTPRPLSSRSYKLIHMSGAMDSTIAYAVNSLCGLEDANSYLNVFSGSATLLIEAGQCYPNLKQLVGFDNNKDYISLAIQNIKKAGLIRKIQIKEANIFNKPNLGRFDVITADLPFGMAISKNEDLEKLYQCFIEYSQDTLHDGGTPALYTSEHEMLKRIILGSRFKIVKTLELKFMTSVNAYLRPNIFVCRLK